MWQLVLVLALVVLVSILLALLPKRSDVVALLPVLVLSVSGILSPADAFSGFVSNAVVVLVSAFVIARGVFNTGALDRLAEAIFRRAQTPTASLLGVLLISTVVSAFFSDTGTLLIMLPVAHRLCARFRIAPSRVMMPLAFSAMLSSTVTLTSASSNLVIASYVSRAGLGELGYFAFAPVGLALTGAGLLVLLILSRRLLPEKSTAVPGPRDYATEKYLTEVKVGRRSGLVGRRAAALDAGPGFPPVEAIRRRGSLFSPTDRITIKEGDSLLLKVDPKDLQELTLVQGLDLARVGPSAADLMEIVLPPASEMVGRSVADFPMEDGDQMSVLGISRRGLSQTEDFSSIKLQVGDVLLIRGSDAALRGTLQRLGCLPLQERGVVVFNRKNTLKALAVFGLVVGLAVSQILTVALAFALGAFLTILLGVISVREAYASIDWPLVVLLGGLLSLGAAMETSGATGLLAGAILVVVGGSGPIVTVLLLLVVALLLTTVMNNAAVAAIMAPIAIGLAQLQGINPLTLLVAIAVGCTLSFLMPYSHQCNLIVQGPGGYRPVDYFRLGIAVVAIAIPVSVVLIPLVWPP